MVMNKPYVNEVILRGQNLSLKCYQPLEHLKYIEKRFKSFHNGNIGSEVSRIGFAFSKWPHLHRAYLLIKVPLHSVWKPKKKMKKLPMVEMLIFCTIMIYLNDLRFKKQNFPKICWEILWFIKGHPLKCKKS